MIVANVIEDAFSPLITLFEGVMVFIHDNLVGGSWGLAIIGLTVVIRAVLVPLTFRQLKSMQEMQRLAPQINELKVKYKEDKQRQQQELMKFYQENKINPLASCLPLLMQIPVFISLFYMLRTDLKKHICPDALVGHWNGLSLQARQPFGELHHAATVKATAVAQLPNKYIEHISCNQVDPHSAKFLFLPDITDKATGAALAVLIVAYVGSQLASTLIATATADPNQRRLMLVLPIIFVIILYRYPAGLLVYWITTNLWTIGQQFLIKRRLPPPPAPTGKAAKESTGKQRSILRPALAGGGGGAAASAGGSDAKAEKAAKPAKPAKDRTTAPPPPPRKKKKRSGRRR
jgi:YidC/Oxa1 family membrane protein insertase